MLGQAGMLALPCFANQPVAWTSLTSNMTIDSDGTLRKSSGGSDWNGGAHSTRSITEGDFTLEFAAHQTGKARMIGLAVNPAGHVFHTIDYTFYLNGGSAFMVYENGNNKTGNASFTDQDRFRIAYTEGDVVYTHLKSTGEEVEV